MLAVLASCDRYSESEMRDRVARFLPVTQTLSFKAKLDCSAGAFRLKDASIGAEVSVATGLIGMLTMLNRRSIVALDDPQVSPDRAMVDAANFDRATGMAMRRAILEARACMDDQLSTEFGRLLSTPGAVLAFDREKTSVMIIDHDNLVVVVARGAT